MKTIKEIEEELQTIEEPNKWIQELEADPRVGVQKALRRWRRQYDNRTLEKEELKKKCAFDRSFAPFNGALVAGVDEAGRGPLAGPVVSAAVILPEAPSELLGLDDSKTISRAARKQLANKIRSVAISYSVHIQPAVQIDELNIYEATRNSMEMAVRSLTVNPDIVVVDAMTIEADCPAESVIKADAKSLAVAAASILAKTERDSLMEALHKEFPAYNFAQNAGYGTAEHVTALKTFGPCDHHRRSFEPVKSLIEKGEFLALKD